MSERPYLRLVTEPVSRPDLRHARRRDVVDYPVSDSARYQLPAYQVLRNATDQPISRAQQNVVSPAAAALAREALGGS